MNNAAFTEDELRQAALQVHEAIMAALTPVAEHEFSFAFHRKMSILQRRMKLRSGLKTVAKSVAAVFLALLIGGAALLTFSSDTRAAFFSWERDIYENSAFYTFTGDKEPEVLPYCRPAWLPEGYAEINAVGNDYQQLVIYQKGEDKNDVILFSYDRISENKILHIQSDSGLEHKEIIVNGFKADLYIPNDNTETNELLWLDDDSGILYGISSYEEIPVILHIAESIYLEE
ncbi:MAG: DUF4367 domain-containing protein [Clostridiales bacterium]|nr:DUF4367 domain-containing protein [Clostridiales bacterium]